MLSDAINNSKHWLSRAADILLVLTILMIIGLGLLAVFN